MSVDVGAPTIVAVDVGGSGLRVQTWSYAAGPGRVVTAPGVRLGAGGIDVPGLISSARSLVGDADLSDAIVVWSMRGLLFLADRGSVLDAVEVGFGARETVVVSDAVASVVGALGGIRPGAVVAAGTGAVAFGTDFGRTWRRVDGWGHVLGDRGSAASVGLAGLRAALRAADGFDDGSPALLAAASKMIGPPETWPRLVMTSADAPERLAALAPLVTATADRDPVAAKICRDAGEALADSLLIAGAGIHDVRLAATGGLLGAAPIASAMDEALARRGATRIPAVGSALDGALALALCLRDTGSVPTHDQYLLHRR